MRRNAFVQSLLSIAIVTGCSREQPAPPQPAAPVTPPATTSSAAPATTSIAPPPASSAKEYDEAMLWFGSAPRFRFTLREGNLTASGTMTRPRLGEEKVELRAGSEEWRAEKSARGVTWSRRAAGGWKPADSPDYGNRVFQRVTFAFDPRKKEGEAQLVEPHHYRFTDANSGKVHEVWLTPQSHIARITIGNDVELRIEE